MSVIHAPRRPELDARQVALLSVVCLALLLLLLRLWYVQVVDGPTYREKAEHYRFSTVDTMAPRGLIVDRKGRLLAGVAPRIVVTAIPSDVHRTRIQTFGTKMVPGVAQLETPWVIEKLAKILGADPRKLAEKVEAGASKPFLPTPIFVGAPVDGASRIGEPGSRPPGIDIQLLPMRYYPNTTDMAHILGYVWTPDENDVERFALHNWSVPQYVGKQGVEWMMEGDLKGKAGTETIEVDSHRRKVRMLKRENAEPGTKLVLTLDRDLQKYSNQVLASIRSQFPNSGAALAAIDPKTGEILALCSYPTYDSSLFSGGITQDEFDALAEDPLNPMFNRAIGGAYSPGSTFKLITSIAAAQSGYFNPNRYYVCKGYYEVGNRKVKCLGTHGAISYRDALSQSCNAYFGDLAFHVKREGLVKAAIDCGLGYRTGIDLRGETTGSVPSDNWIKAIEKKEGRKVTWYPGQTVNVGIGQGEVNATPLQMANVAALVANGGYNFKPHLVHARVSHGMTVPVPPEEAHHIELPASVWSDIQAGMIGVIDHGTGKFLERIPGVTWAGKTGSTEALGQQLTHSWFVGYAPANDPKIAIAVVVERAGHGGKVAGPLAVSVLKEFFRQSAAKDSPPEAPVGQNAAPNQ